MNIGFNSELKDNGSGWGGVGRVCKSETSAEPVSETQDHWVDDGSHTENDGNPDDVVGAFYSSDSASAYPRCCAIDGSDCSSNYSCRSGSPLMTFQQAADYCDNEGRRLCTKVELESEICRGTGGG